MLLSTIVYFLRFWGGGGGRHERFLLVVKMLKFDENKRRGYKLATYFLWCNPVILKLLLRSQKLIMGGFQRVKLTFMLVKGVFLQ